MALAADGVGSCRHSDIASKAAIEAACRFAETAFPVRVTEDDLLAFIRTMANYAANAVDRYVLKHEGNFEDYHTTLVIALYNGKDLYYANAGDSGIVVLDERGCYHILTEQQNTEYGEVITLAQRRFAVGKAPFGVSAVACMTDGLLEWCCPNSLNEHKFKVSVPRMELLIPQSIWFGDSEADDAAMAIHAQNAADKLNKLSERVLEEEEYGGRKVKTTVEHEIKEAKYNTPEDQWDSTREEEIKASYDLIKDMKLGNKVFSFIGRDKTIFDNPAGFGRFLWSVRHNIGNRELYNLIELLSRIAYLSKDREQQAEIIEETTPAQPAQFESKDADTVYRKRSAAKLQKPRLPNFFNEELAINENAVKSYYDTLHRCGFYIGRTLLSHEKRDPDIRYYAGWKWKHLREAFVKLGFIKKDSSKKGFAEYLADVFPYLEATNIQRGFNSRGGYTDPNATRRIINDMVSEFEEVSDLINGG